jgi:hypothetical protein
LAPGAGERAEDGLYDTVEACYWRGCALAAAGRTAEAVAEYEAVLQNCRPDYGPLPVYLEMKPVYWAAIAALARLLPESHTFVALCDAQSARWEERSLADRRFWYGAEAGPAGADVTGGIKEITDQMLAEWQWSDPNGDGECHIGGGVELVAADGRDRWYINTGAPSLGTAVEGDFALQVRCQPATLRPLTMGGLLLWCDGANFLRLDWGGLGPGEISCLGASGGARRFWGRARTNCPQPYLRLERCGQGVRALYSEDGRQWLLAGETALAGAGPWAAGLFGLGMVDRTVHPGAPAGGAAIRFAEIRLWQG